MFSNSLTLSEIAGGFSGSVFFFEDDTNVPYNLFSSSPYVLFSFSEIYLKTQMIYIQTIHWPKAHVPDTKLKLLYYVTVSRHTLGFSGQCVWPFPSDNNSGSHNIA